MKESPISDFVFDRMWTIQKRLKASSMRDMSEFEMRQYVKQAMALEAGGSLIQSGNVPMLNNQAERFPSSLTPEQATQGVFHHPMEYLGVNDVDPEFGNSPNRLTEV